MGKIKKNPLDVKLDPEEQEIEDALPKSKTKLPVTKNLTKELAAAKEAAANYLQKKPKSILSFPNMISRD